MRKMYSAVKAEPAFINEMTKARRHHDVASSTAAAEIVMLPTFVFSKLSSVRILAKTGNAVIAIATPKKRKYFVNPV